MILDLLPHRTAGAAENMAADFLLLQRYPEIGHARFRHYDWRGPAFTFGYSQKIAYVREQLALLAPDEYLDLTRRPTGGGIVDHRDDWTFALVIPRGHALYDARATESYRQVHTALTEALREQGQAVVLKESCGSCEGDEDYGIGDGGLDPTGRANGSKGRSPFMGDSPVCDDDPLSFADPVSPINGLLPSKPADRSTLKAKSAAIARTKVKSATNSPATGPTVCFTRPELYDVLHAETGAKVAGAAQKRTKHGLLFQGSISKAALTGTASSSALANKSPAAPAIDWDAFEESFAARLATMLLAEPTPASWPEFAEGEMDGLIEQYSATEWVEYR